MPPTVVVCVQFAGGLRRDLELPVNVPAGILATNVAQAIHSIDTGENQPAKKCVLKRLMNGEVFDRERSLAEYNVVHGEILELVQHGSPGPAMTGKEQSWFAGPGFIDSSGLVFEIDAKRILVGRSNPKTGVLDSSIDLDLTQVDALETPTIAERQAEIQFHSDQFLICDLSKSGGTIVNLRPLEPHQPVVLRHGDHVSFGDAKLVFIWDGNTRGFGKAMYSKSIKPPSGNGNPFVVD